MLKSQLKSWSLLAALALAAFPAAAQPLKIAVIGLIHSHEGGYVPRMTRSDQVKLVGIAETIPDLVNLAKEKQGAKDVPFFDDYKRCLTKPSPTSWAFVENNRHSPQRMRSPPHPRDLRKAACVYL